MDGDTLRVRATIRLLATSDGGRYRPNHNFLGPTDRDMVIGVIDLPEGRELRPGETMEVDIAFWQAPGLGELLHPGRRWRIQEASKLVGIGTVVAVLS